MVCLHRANIPSDAHVYPSLLPDPRVRTLIAARCSTFHPQRLSASLSQRPWAAASCVFNAATLAFSAAKAASRSAICCACRVISCRPIAVSNGT